MHFFDQPFHNTILSCKNQVLWIFLLQGLYFTHKCSKKEQGRFILYCWFIYPWMTPTLVRTLIMFLYTFIHFSSILYFMMWFLVKTCKNLHTNATFWIFRKNSIWSWFRVISMFYVCTFQINYFSNQKIVRWTCKKACQ